MRSLIALAGLSFVFTTYLASLALAETDSATTCSKYRAKGQMFLCKVNPCCNFTQTSKTKRETMGKTYIDIHWKCEPSIAPMCQGDKASSIDKLICAQDDKGQSDKELAKDADNIAAKMEGDSAEPTSVPDPKTVFADASAIGFYFDSGKKMTRGECKAPNSDQTCLQVMWNLQISEYIEDLSETQKFNLFFTSKGKISAWKPAPVFGTKENKEAAKKFMDSRAGSESPNVGGKEISLKSSVKSQGIKLAVVIGTGDVLGFEGGSIGIDQKIRTELAAGNRDFDMTFISAGVSGEEYKWAEELVKRKVQDDLGSVVVLEPNAPRFLFLFPKGSKNKK